MREATQQKQSSKKETEAKKQDKQRTGLFLRLDLRLDLVWSGCFLPFLLCVAQILFLAFCVSFVDGCDWRRLGRAKQTVLERNNRVFSFFFFGCCFSLAFL